MNIYNKNNILKKVNKMRNRVVLTESQLRRVVENAVKRILSEGDGTYREKKIKEKLEQFDHSERIGGGCYLCRKGNKWCVLDNSGQRITEFHSNRQDAKDESKGNYDED